MDALTYRKKTGTYVLDFDHVIQMHFSTDDTRVTLYTKHGRASFDREGNEPIFALLLEIRDIGLDPRINSIEDATQKVGTA